MKTINPGFYKDLSIEDYHSSNGISKSGIMKVARSPLHYWHHYLNPEKEPETRGEHLLLGDVVHTMLMEPHKFDERFCLAPKVDKRTKEGKETWAEFESTIGNKDALREDVYTEAFKMFESANKNKEFMSLIEGGTFESSIYFNESDHGVLCKSRPDILFDGFVSDIKTTKDASPESFARDCIKFGYDVQFAMCQMAVFQQFGKMIKDFFILVVEKEFPYNTGIYLMSDEMIHYGRKRFIDNIKIFKRCAEGNEWPSYGLRTLELPNWLKKYP